MTLGFKLFSILALQISAIYCDEQQKSKEESKRKARQLHETVSEVGITQSIDLIQDIPLFWKKSRYQEVGIYSSRHFGKVLVIDDAVQLTEKDADSYNEMMAHVPLMEHSYPKNVLIIGGGDGFILNEVLKHNSVERVDHVDLDEVVIEASMEHFSMRPWRDKRVNLHISDGADFIKKAPREFYDVIIQDSSDPDYIDEDGNNVLLPASVLFTEEHFANCYQALKKDGIFSLEAGSWNFPSDIEGIVDWRKRALNQGFNWVRYGNIVTGSYPMGHIGFLLCKKDDTKTVSNQRLFQRFKELEDTHGTFTTYYHPSLHRSCFEVPWKVEKIFYRVEEDCVVEDGSSSTKSPNESQS